MHTKSLLPIAPPPPEPPNNFRVSTTTSDTITFIWDALDNEEPDGTVNSYIITCSEGNHSAVSAIILEFKGSKEKVMKQGNRKRRMKQERLPIPVDSNGHLIQILCFVPPTCLLFNNIMNLCIPHQKKEWHHEFHKIKFVSEHLPQQLITEKCNGNYASFSAMFHPLHSDTNEEQQYEKHLCNHYGNTGNKCDLILATGKLY